MLPLRHFIIKANLMQFKKLFILSLLSFSVLHANSIVGININDTDLELQGSSQINSLSDYSSGTTYIVDANYINSNGADMGILAFSGQNRLQGVEGLTVAFGLKAIFASEYLSFPLMAKLSYLLPLPVNFPRTNIIGNFAFAPSVLTFRDGENYSEIKIEADIEIISNVYIFAGYRKIDTDYQNFIVNYNDSFFAGLKLSF